MENAGVNLGCRLLMCLVPVGVGTVSTGCPDDTTGEDAVVIGGDVADSESDGDGMDADGGGTDVVELDGTGDLDSGPDAETGVDVVDASDVDTDDVADGGDGPHATAGRIHSGIPATVGEVVDLEFVDDDAGWAAFGGDAVARTEDGGRSWSVDPVGVGGAVRSVSFVDGSVGWAVGAADAVGDTGGVARTGNGGEEWTVQKTDVGAPLNAVDFADDQQGWAVGAGGTVVATEDGGTTWSTQTSGVDADLVDVEFADGETGWAVGRNGVVVHTSDGGDSWTSQESGVSSTIHALSFVDAEFGRAVTGSGDILTTDDGGSTWNVLEFADVAMVDVHFADRMNGWFALDERGIYRTEDGGSVVGRVSATEVLLAVHGEGANTAWAGGKGGRIEYTTNGEDWSEADRGIRAGEFRGVAAGGDRLWAAGPTGGPHSRIWSSNDGGETWTESRTVEHEPLNDIDSGQGGVVAVGNRGKLFHRPSGGGSWSERDSDTSNELNTVDVAGGGIWAVGMGNGPVVRSTDGENWEYVTTPVGGHLWALHAFDADRAWIAADSDTFYSTDDGGDSWTARETNFGETSRLYDMTFVDDQHGWAVGSRARVFRTTDGGDTWTLHETPFDEVVDLRAVLFADPDRGWAFAEDGRVVETTDGGEKWERADLRAPLSVLDTDLRDDGTGFAVGAGEGVVRIPDESQ